MKKLVKIITTFSSIYLLSIPTSFNEIEKNNIVFKKKNNNYVPCDNNSKNEKIKTKKQINKEHEIVVFIHGTIIPYPSFSTTIKTLKGNKYSPIKRRSFLHKYVSNLRYQGIYPYQPINDLGLIKMPTSKKSNCSVQENSCFKMAKFYNNYVQESSNKKYSYYTFGWDGRLDHKKRLAASEKLYNQLLDEIQKLNTNNTNTYITILAHSHGGNVALNLAKIEEKNKKNLKIKNLVLFGTPIQSETAENITSDIFEKIYNIFSRGDPVQVIDIISTKDIFSKRKFKNKKNGLPEKLTQVEVFCGKLKPMHNELWFFKEKGNALYRRRLCTNPYPISIFTPYIISIINDMFAKNENLILNIEKEKDRFKLSFKDPTNLNQNYIHYSNFPLNS